MTTATILPQKPFYLVRHGESEANIRRVIAGGTLDSPLTENGISQAQTLASVIHHLPVKPSRIYHSPQIRAKHTAGYLNNFLQLEMIEMDDLKEHIFGDWEQASWDDILPLLDKGVNPPNGETYEEFANRIQSAFRTIHTTIHETPPMIVAHGGVFNSIGRLYNFKIDKVKNCALYHFIPASGKSPMPWDIYFYEHCQVKGLKKLVVV